MTMPKNIYFCDACRYCFPATKRPDRCIDCGKMSVRVATDEEVIEYERIRAEIEAENDG